MAKKATRGNNAQFTYDFGIAIAQSTVNKITRLTGATLTLASAYYALKTTATQYVDTLRENTLRFGGMLSTMKAMEDAQRRLIKGQSYFAPDDQLRGMNQLMAVGVKVGENLEWINKAAHATGRSFSDFSGLTANRYPFVLSCPLSAIGVWVTVWVSRFDPYCFHLKKLGKPPFS